MSWMSPAVLTLLVTVALTLSLGADGASILDGNGEPRRANYQGVMSKIFMPEADASNFFKRRGRRAVKSQDELDAEQRQRLAADKRKRDFHEEQRNQFENYAEEESDEQDERTRESTEQYREFHYDGMDPPQDINRHAN